MQTPSDPSSYRSEPAGENIPASRPLIVTTTEHIPEARVVKTLGQVFGLTVRSRSLGGNIAALLKSLVGGEVRSYVKLNEDARRQALDRMVKNAAAMGANAVTMMRFDSTVCSGAPARADGSGTARTRKKTHSQMPFRKRTDS